MGEPGGNVIADVNYLLPCSHRPRAVLLRFSGMAFRLLSRDPWLPSRGREHRVIAPLPPPSPFVPPPLPDSSSAESLIRDEEEFDQFVREAEARQAAACFQHFFYEEPEVPGCSLTPLRLDRR